MKPARERPLARAPAHWLEPMLSCSKRTSVRATTWANYRTYLNAYVIPVVGQTRLGDLTAVRLNLLYGRLLTEGRARGSGGLAPKTVQNIHRMLHRALRDAVRWNYLPRNVAEDASPPRGERRRPNIWTPQQLRIFVQHVQGDRFFALWLLVVTTGFRRGELAGLDRRDVDLEHGRVSPTTARVVVDGHVQESGTKTPAASGQSRSTRPPTRRCAPTSTPGPPSGNCLARTPSSCSSGPTGAHCTRHHHRTIRPAPSCSRPPPHPAARRPAFLRQRRPESRCPSQGRQRAPRTRHRGLHAPGLQPRHPRHGPDRRHYRRRPNHRRRSRRTRATRDNRGSRIGSRPPRSRGTKEN
jgi:hypothetical protein